MSEMKCRRCGANENRIHGFCSMECRTAWEYEDDIRDLTARIAELERLVETYTTSNGLRNRVLQDIVEKQTKHIAELEEFKMIVEGCGFGVITEPPVLNHPERKILKGHGTIYVPELSELPEVK